MRDWDELLAVHLRTAFELARGVARNLINQGKPGSIVFIGSLTSARACIPETSAYAAAKRPISVVRPSRSTGLVSSVM